MCGRARCTLGVDDIPRACHCSHGPVRTVNMDRFRLLFNVSSGSNLHVVRREDGAHGDDVVVHCMKCGLIPSFTKKTEKPDHYKMIGLDPWMIDVPLLVLVFSLVLICSHRLLKINHEELCDPEA